MSRTTKALSGMVMALAMTIPVVTPAVARPGGPGGGAGRIATSGQCSGNSTWSLSGRSRFLRVVVTARVDTAPRQRWVVRLEHNQSTVAAFTRKATGRGVVKAKGLVSNQPGPDTFTFVARNRSTAEICQGTLTF